MTDYDMMELLAADAPAPAPGYVDEMLARARRARLRRRVAGSGAGLGVAVVFVVAAAVITLPPDGHLSTASPTPIASSESVMPRSAEATVYVTAIEALAEDVRGGGPPVPVVYIEDHTCANIVDPTQLSCDPRPLSASMRDELTAGLVSYAPVRFVSDGQEVTDPNLTVINGGVVVTLGPARMSPDRAQVPLAVRRSGLNGQGLTYVLTRSGQTWHIDGTIGPQWIS